MINAYNCSIDATFNFNNLSYISQSPSGNNKFTSYLIRLKKFTKWRMFISKGELEVMIKQANEIYLKSSCSDMFAYESHCRYRRC